MVLICVSETQHPNWTSMHKGKNYVFKEHKDIKKIINSNAKCSPIESHSSVQSKMRSFQDYPQTRKISAPSVPKRSHLCQIYSCKRERRTTVTDLWHERSYCHPYSAMRSFRNTLILIFFYFHLRHCNWKNKRHVINRAIELKTCPRQKEDIKFAPVKDSSPAPDVSAY